LATIAAQGGPPGGKVEILQSQLYIYFNGKFGIRLTFENIYISPQLPHRAALPGGEVEILKNQLAAKFAI